MTSRACDAPTPCMTASRYRPEPVAMSMSRTGLPGSAARATTSLMRRTAPTSSSRSVPIPCRHLGEVVAQPRRAPALLPVVHRSPPRRSRSRGSGIAPCRRNAAGANINDSIRITGIGDSTHVLSRNRSGSSTPPRRLVPVQRRHVLHHRREQRVPLRVRQRHPLRQRLPLFGRAQRMEIPRQAAHDHPLDITRRPAGRCHPGAGRSCGPVVGADDRVAVHGRGAGRRRREPGDSALGSGRTGERAHQPRGVDYRRDARRNWKTLRMVAHYSAGATAERGAVARYL